MTDSFLGLSLCQPLSVAFLTLWGFSNLLPKATGLSRAQSGQQVISLMEFK